MGLCEVSPDKIDEAVRSLGAAPFLGWNTAPWVRRRSGGCKGTVSRAVRRTALSWILDERQANDHLILQLTTKPLAGACRHD